MLLNLPIKYTGIYGRNKYHIKFIDHHLNVNLFYPGNAEASNSRAKRSHPPLVIPYADWNTVAEEELAATLRRPINTNVAKNVIMFIGDGMGVSTVTGARILKVQDGHDTPDKTKLTMDQFDYTGLAQVI